MADTSYTPNESAELPFSLEAEQTILGAILLDSSVLPVVLETIRPESFFNEQHKELFQIISRCSHPEKRQTLSRC